MTHCVYCKQEINDLWESAKDWDAGIMTTEIPPSQCAVNVRHVFATCKDKDYRVSLQSKPLLQEGVSDLWISTYY